MAEDEEEQFRRCSYCFRSKLTAEFNLEHIWPDALGGDALSGFWKTTNVCARCNELSGRFVDGEFIKSWFVVNERAEAARPYLNAAKPEAAWLPLTYIGNLEHDVVPTGMAAEFWLGPCGDHIFHLRPTQEPGWETYAGGKPTRKRLDWGRAYMALCSADKFWALTAVHSFHRHFRRGERYLVNAPAPQGFQPPFSELDQSQPGIVNDLVLMELVSAHAEAGTKLKLRAVIAINVGSRFLAKLALGIGREVLGDAFLDTLYARVLRGALWERDNSARAKMAVRGSGYLQGAGQHAHAAVLRWPGAWVIWLQVVGGELACHVVSPGGKDMTVLVSDERELVSSWAEAWPEGQVYLTVAATAEAVGPIGGAEYIAHQLGNIDQPRLTELARQRAGIVPPPPCR